MNMQHAVLGTEPTEKVLGVHGQPNDGSERNSKFFPLVVDLDGTLIKTDLLLESLVLLLKKNFFFLFCIPIWLLRGRQYLKLQIAQHCTIRNDLLPYNLRFLAFLKQQEEEGRTLILATASNEKLANELAQYVGIFSYVFASNAEINLIGRNKAAVLVEKFGSKGFDYAGNSNADLKIWPDARQVILVNPDVGVEKRARKIAPIDMLFEEREHFLASSVRAMRVHQWLKNLLIFVPLLAAHKWGDAGSVMKAGLAFIAFSFCASAIYLLNDIVDLHADRAHLRKRSRPFASGNLPLTAGFFLIPTLSIAGLLIASLVNIPFLLCLVFYIFVTSVYSFHLKSIILLDVIVLALLYTFRVLAGAWAIDVAASFWLIAFSMLIFFSLALIKRCAELESLKKQNRRHVKGRDYRVTDLAQLTGLGTASGIGAVIILSLYINSPETAQHYKRAQMLWPLCPALLYWICRMWVKTGRGEMHDDPIVFAAKDRTSWGVALIVLAIFVFAL